MPALFIQSSLMLPGQCSSLCHVEAEPCDCRNFCRLSTWLGDPRFSGHIIRDSWCHGHIRCLAPHAMAIENPRVGIHGRAPIQSVQSPQENRNDVRLGPEMKGPDPEKAGCVPGRDSFHREKIYGLLSAGAWLRPEEQ